MCILIKAVILGVLLHSARLCSPVVAVVGKVEGRVAGEELCRESESGSERLTGFWERLIGSLERAHLGEGESATRGRMVLRPQYR